MKQRMNSTVISCYIELDYWISCLRPLTCCDKNAELANSKPHKPYLSTAFLLMKSWARWWQRLSRQPAGQRELRHSCMASVFSRSHPRKWWNLMTADVRARANIWVELGWNETWVFCGDRRERCMSNVRCVVVWHLATSLRVAGLLVLVIFHCFVSSIVLACWYLNYETLCLHLFFYWFPFSSSTIL